MQSFIIFEKQKQCDKYRKKINKQSFMQQFFFTKNKNKNVKTYYKEVWPYVNLRNNKLTKYNSFP